MAREVDHFARHRSNVGGAQEGEQRATEKGERAQRDNERVQSKTADQNTVDQTKPSANDSGYHEIGDDWQIEINAENDLHRRIHGKGADGGVRDIDTAGGENHHDTKRKNAGHQTVASKIDQRGGCEKGRVDEAQNEGKKNRDEEHDTLWRGKDAGQRVHARFSLMTSL